MAILIETPTVPVETLTTPIIVRSSVLDSASLTIPDTSTVDRIYGRQVVWNVTADEFVTEREMVYLTAVADGAVDGCISWEGVTVPTGVPMDEATLTALQARARELTDQHDEVMGELAAFDLDDDDPYLLEDRQHRLDRIEAALDGCPTVRFTPAIRTEWIGHGDVDDPDQTRTFFYPVTTAFDTSYTVLDEARTAAQRQFEVRRDTSGFESGAVLRLWQQHSADEQ